jgi:hypothetical protein
MSSPGTSIICGGFASEPPPPNLQMLKTLIRMVLNYHLLHVLLCGLQINRPDAGKCCANGCHLCHLGNDDQESLYVLNADTFFPKYF